MLSSSVSAHLTPPVMLALLAIPLGYAALVELTVRTVRPQRLPLRTTLALLPLGAWLVLGVYGFSLDWTTRQDGASPRTRTGC